MGIYANVEKYEEKLSEILARNNLLYKFQTERYPAVITIYQDQDVGSQMELYSNADAAVSSPDAVLRFIFRLGGLDTQTDGRLVIADKLLSKIKGAANKLHQAYLHAYFAEARSGKRAPEPSDDGTEQDAGDFDEFYEDEEDREDPDGKQDEE